MKYIIGDVVIYEDKEYLIGGIDRMQYSLYDPVTSISRSKKGWKVDNAAIPVSLVPRVKEPKKEDYTQVVLETTDNKPSFWSKFKFWN